MSGTDDVGDDVKVRKPKTRKNKKKNKGSGKQVNFA